MMTNKIAKIINMFDEVGIYAITPQIVIDYLYGKDKSITVANIIHSIEELSAQDRIVWDATKTYFRPTQYLLGGFNGW